MVSRRLARFARYSFREKRLLLEATVLLAVARVAILTVPFRWVAPSLGRRRGESPVEADASETKRAKEIGWAVETMSRHTFWKSACLAQAIAAQWMLNRRGLPGTLYLGAAKDDARGFIAHAWVRSGPLVLTGSRGHENYAVLTHYADRG
jgi:hypothetical protein